MIYKNIPMTLNRRKHRNLLICLIAFIPMACAAGPLADRESREVSDFNTIEVGGLVNVKIQQGNKVGVDVRAYGIAMQDIITKVKDETLLVTTKGSHRGESIAINVTYTNLLAIKTSGAATIETMGVLKGESLKIEITDAGDANLELDVNRLNIDMRGAGNLRLTGNAMSQSLTSHGGGGSLDNARLEIATQ
ncbi:MAG: DUF2807 domain-containing protein [Arenicella sp.]|jgi:hypothetical protein|nr:DUF2807 domain-containing protein [Arenicella sp.]